MKNRNDVVNAIVLSVNKALIDASPRAMVGNAARQIKATLMPRQKVKVFALGKAGLGLFNGFVDVVEEKYISSALVISHQIDEVGSIAANTQFVYAPHPIMDCFSYEAGAKAQEFFGAVGCDERVICLISGGGSSMMVLPNDLISFEEKKSLIDNIILRGIPEREVNEIRKKLSAVKGGRIIQALPRCSIENVFLSDERSHNFDAISSGPTIPFHEDRAMEVVNEYELANKIPPKILEILRRPNPNPNLKISVKNQLCGTRIDVLEAISHHLKSTNLFVSVTTVQEPIHSVAPLEAIRLIEEKVRKIKYAAKPGAHVLVLPTEVQVKAKKGSKGGRNQHLAALAKLEMNVGGKFYFVGLATDGVDFIDGVHGAFCVSDQQLDARAQNHLHKALASTNSYFWHLEQGTLIEGPKTGHNVSDLAIVAFVN